MSYYFQYQWTVKSITFQRTKDISLPTMHLVCVYSDVSYVIKIQWIRKLKSRCSLAVSHGLYATQVFPQQCAPITSCFSSKKKCILTHTLCANIENLRVSIHPSIHDLLFCLSVCLSVYLPSIYLLGCLLNSRGLNHRTPKFIGISWNGGAIWRMWID